MKERRYDLDWWRVISIFAVYLHHIGMPFNGDGFHIMNAQSSKLLDDIMVYFEQVRLPLLFLISGVGTIFAFKKRTALQFTGERFKRLYIPLIFGMFVIVPPQTYFQYRDQFASYSDLMMNLTDHLTFNHLWFLDVLFLMSITCIPVTLFLYSDISKRFRMFIEKFASKHYALLALVIPLIILKIILKTYFPSDSKSFFNPSSTVIFAYYFIFGMILCAVPKLWDDLVRDRKRYLFISILTSMAFYGYYYFNEIIFSTTEMQWAGWYAISTMLGWVVILTMLGYGVTMMNRQSKLLKKMNEGIYPFYVLHQSVIVVFAYYIVQMELSIALKMILLLLSTFPAIVLIYLYVIYPFRLLRFLFGMKKKVS